MRGSAGGGLTNERRALGVLTNERRALPDHQLGGLGAEAVVGLIRGLAHLKQPRKFNYANERHHVILESAQGPNLFFRGLLFDLGVCWDRGLDLDLDQGLTICNIYIHA